MEKTKHSVVKHLIAVAVALLLFGSSGGVAWGQLSGPTGFDNSTAHTTTQGRCDGTYKIDTWTWYADNNFGPGETGIITPLTSGRSQNRGYHKSTNLGVNTLNPFSPGAGIITVGGTQNIVQNVHNTDHIHDGCTNGPHSWSNGDDGSSPTVEDWGSFSQDHTKWNGSVYVSSSVDLYAGDNQMCRMAPVS